MRNSYRVCSLEGCGRKHSSKGYCNLHYQRLIKHGDPLAGPPLRKTSWGDPLAWLMEKLTYSGDECSEWPYANDGHGYGHLQVDGKTVKAHRYMCELVNGPPPFERAEAAHSCGRGNLGCITPGHLRWATPKSNQWDRLDHGTDNRGERCGTHKLSEEEVLIIDRLLVGGRSHQSIADEYGVHRCTITDIAKGKNWGWLTGRFFAGNPVRPANDNHGQERTAA